MSFFIRFARQWIAGENLDDAIISSKKANNMGIGAIVNFLGEHVKDKDEAEKNKIENLGILWAIKDAKINSSLFYKTHAAWTWDRQKPVLIPCGNDRRRCK